jgi:hypothetical protein
MKSASEYLLSGKTVIDAPSLCKSPCSSCLTAFVWGLCPLLSTGFPPLSLFTRPSCLSAGHSNGSAHQWFRQSSDGAASLQFQTARQAMSAGKPQKTQLFCRILKSSIILQFLHGLSPRRRLCQHRLQRWRGDEPHGPQEQDLGASSCGGHRTRVGRETGRPRTGPRHGREDS